MLYKFFPSISAIVGLGAMAIVQFHADSFTAYREVVEVALLLAAVIGTAYVTRSDVQSLKKWAWGKDGMNEQMSMMREILAALNATAQTNERRIRRIEDREDNPRRGR